MLWIFEVKLEFIQLCILCYIWIVQKRFSACVFFPSFWCKRKKLLCFRKFELYFFLFHHLVSMLCPSFDFFLYHFFKSARLISAGFFFFYMYQVNLDHIGYIWRHCEVNTNHRFVRFEMIKRNFYALILLENLLVCVIECC